MARKRNLTVQLDEAVIDKARVVAAKRGTSVSGLVRQQIEELVLEDDRYGLAKRRALEYLRRGFKLKYQPVNREELHDRKTLR